uniref:Uncharacterized protein n=1 Tax=Coccidioides posadasii RMSCC 3488 TaxID=454284 RepID=A0A0J6FPL1_COCPO|nr:hypothetical protein CPAG_07697 [Coccidioides posadasii RMSCC 3488]
MKITHTFLTSYGHTTLKKVAVFLPGFLLIRNPHNHHHPPSPHRPLSKAMEAKPVPQPAAVAGGLGDLWSDSAPSSAPPAQPQTSSLRLGRGANTPQSSGFKPSASSLPSRPSPSSTPRHPFDRSQSARQPGSNTGNATGGARPLPSQMAGSYQASQAAQNRPGPDRTLSAASAQERLRARLHGGGVPAATLRAIL